MADWLDTADKVASIVGAATGVAALVLTLRSNSRRDSPAPGPGNTAAPEAASAAMRTRLPPAPDPVGPFTVPDWSDAASRAGSDRGTPPVLPDHRSGAERRPERRTPPQPPLFSGSEPVPPPAYPQQGAGQPGWGSPPGGGPPRPAQPPMTGWPERALDPSGESGSGPVLGVLVFGVGSLLLGALLLSWLGGGSIGPWWLVAGMAVSYGLGIFFMFADLDGRGVVLLYVIWSPAAAWLAGRAVVHYWFPDLFANQGAGFVVVFVAVLLIAAAGGLVKSFSSR